LCNDEACPAIIGDILIYRDDSHITDAAAQWLEPELWRALQPIVEGR